MAEEITRGYGLFEGFLARKRAEKAKSLIPSELRCGRVLDIGCGATPVFLLNTGFVEKYALDRVAPQTSFEGISFVENDLSGMLPFPDDFFDVVTMLAVFEHIEPERTKQILAEVHRILKPPGAYIMTTPAKWSDALLRVMARLRLVSETGMQEHKASYTRKEISLVLKEVGFGNWSSGYSEKTL